MCMTVLQRIPPNRWRRAALAPLVLVAALTLTACGGRETDQATPVPTATATAAAAIAVQPPATQPPATLPLAATSTPSPTATDTPLPTATPTATATPIHPLSIEYLRQQSFPGSELVIEQTLAPGSNYDRYYVVLPLRGTDPVWPADGAARPEAGQRLAGDHLQPRLHPTQRVPHD